MKFAIKHEIKGRMRIHVAQYRMSCAQADTLLYFLQNDIQVSSAKVYERTGDAVICYDGSRAELIDKLRHFHYEDVEVPNGLIENSGRELNASYQEKLIGRVVRRYASKIFLPYPIRACWTTVKSFRYIWKGIKTLAARKIEVPVLDATAIGVSILRGDTETAGSIMFLLGIGELLEEWTHKKSVADLAQTMSLNVDKVWKETDAGSVLVPVADVQVGDRIVIHTGNVIPLDGKVVSGEAMVNQASITGEPLAVRKAEGGYVYAGTVIEEGDCTICVEKSAGSGRYDRIIRMIEESEKLKSATEDHASHLADQLVPYSLGATALVWLLTGNMTKALAVLMVDFSCALKLSMPIAVLSAMKEASDYHLSVKGGRFLEAVSDASTIVFDKTGTLTQGTFKVTGIHPAEGVTDAALVEAAALAESWSKHPISLSIKAAYGKPIDAARVTDVQELGGHGVTAKVDGRTVAAGNARLMEKLGIAVPAVEGVGTIVHVAVEGSYAGYLLIADVVKPHSADAIRALKASGVRKTVMLTGDAQPVAQAVAQQLGLDEYHAGLLPGDKVDQIEKLLAAKQPKENLAFVGDGINDAPVLSRADVGIAMGALGSDAAIEAADVVLMDDDPAKIALAMRIARRTLRIVHQNIVFALGIKALCLLLGALGIAGMWAAIFADVGVMVIAVLNATRALYTKDLAGK